MAISINSNNSQFLISVNQDSEILIDNIFSGTVIKDQPTIFKVFPGEHYVEARSVDGKGRYRALHTVHSGYQEIIEIKLLPSDVSIGLTGQFVDKRDNQKYKTTTVNGVTWLGENLRYNIHRSWCYENNQTTCAKHGRLYHIDHINSACPEGWHLASREEWLNLVKLYSPSTLIQDLVPGGKSNFNLVFGGWVFGRMSDNKIMNSHELDAAARFWLGEATFVHNHSELGACALFDGAAFRIDNTIARQHSNRYFGGASLRLVKD